MVTFPSKYLMGKGFLRGTGKILKSSTSLIKGITIWIERDDKVFNHGYWCELKVKHHIWDELIVYAKATWERVIKQMQISSFSVVAMLQDFY